MVPIGSHFTLMKVEQTYEANIFSIGNEINFERSFTNALPIKKGLNNDDTKFFRISNKTIIVVGIDNSVRLSRTPGKIECYYKILHDGVYLTVIWSSAYSTHFIIKE